MCGLRFFASFPGTRMRSPSRYFQGTFRISPLWHLSHRRSAPGPPCMAEGLRNELRLPLSEFARADIL